MDNFIPLINFSTEFIIAQKCGNFKIDSQYDKNFLARELKKFY